MAETNKTKFDIVQTTGTTKQIDAFFYLILVNYTSFGYLSRTYNVFSYYIKSKFVHRDKQANRIREAFPPDYLLKLSDLCKNRYGCK